MIFHDRTNDHFEISYSILYNGIWNGNIFWVQIVLRSPWRINGAEIKFPQKVKTKQNNRNVMKEIILDPDCHLFECTHVCKSNICTHQPRQTVMCFRMYQRGQGSQDQTFDYENCQNHHPLIEEKNQISTPHTLLLVSRLTVPSSRSSQWVVVSTSQNFGMLQRTERKMMGRMYTQPRQIQAQIYCFGIGEW